MNDYGPDLAFIHDDGFGQLASAAADVALAALAPVAPATVVELGCGSGLTAARLAAAGHDVLGYDPSPSMLALARERVPGARFAAGTAAGARLPRCDAVLAIGEVLNYATAGDPSGRRLERIFARAHAALRPGGLFLFDLAGPGRVPAGTARSFATGGDWAILVETREDPRAGTLERRMTTFRAHRGAYRREDSVHRQQLHAAGPAAAALRAAGFTARVLRGYAGVPFAPGHRAFVARRGPRRQAGGR